MHHSSFLPIADTAQVAPYSCCAAQPLPRKQLLCLPRKRLLCLPRKQLLCSEPVSFARLQSGAHMRQYGRNGAMRPRRGARATRCVRMSLCDCVRARMRQCGRGGAATAHTRALVKRAGGRVMRFRSSEMVYPLGLSSHRLSDISLRRVFGISLARLFLTPFLGLIPTPVVSLSPCVSP